MVNRERTKRVMLIMLIASICILAAGFSGRIVMSGITNIIMNMNILGGLGAEQSEIEKVLNRGAGRALIQLTTSLIKNDSAGFVNAAKEVMKAIGSVAGDSGISDLLLGSLVAEIAEAAFQEARVSLVESAGAYMPLLQFAAYCSELLVIGGIATAISLLLWFVTGGTVKDIRKEKIAVTVGAAWVCGVFIMAFFAQGNLDGQTAETLSDSTTIYETNYDQGYSELFSDNQMIYNEEEYEEVYYVDTESEDMQMPEMTYEMAQIPEYRGNYIYSYADLSYMIWQDGMIPGFNFSASELKDKVESLITESRMMREYVFSDRYNDFPLIPSVDQISGAYLRYYFSQLSGMLPEEIVNVEFNLETGEMEFYSDDVIDTNYIRRNIVAYYFNKDDGLLRGLQYSLYADTVSFNYSGITWSFDDGDKIITIRDYDLDMDANYDEETGRKYNVLVYDTVM